MNNKLTQLSFDRGDLWWIDYMEGEVTESQRQDMKLLLKHSATEKCILNNFKKLKWVLKESEESEILQSGDGYFNKLQAKIMNEVVAVQKAQEVQKGESPKRRKKKGTTRKSM